jgi:hypothetical protein
VACLETDHLYEDLAPEAEVQEVEWGVGLELGVGLEWGVGLVLLDHEVGSSDHSEELVESLDQVAVDSKYCTEAGGPLVGHKPDWTFPFVPENPKEVGAEIA